MDDLKTEFEHHQQKIEEYNMLLKLLQKQHDISDNSVHVHERLNENEMEKMKDELKEKFSEMNEHYAQLKEKLTGQGDEQPFEDYRVVELWERALERNFSKNELQSIKVFCLLTLIYIIFFSSFPPSVKINISKFKFDHGRGPQVYQLTAVTCLPSLKKNKVDYVTVPIILRQYHQSCHIYHFNLLFISGRTETF
jgi:hypothetical protein